jgi:penicillin-binding protein 2B
MQQIAAVASVANGGKLMQPHLLKKVVDSETQKVVFENKPKMIRRTITEQSAQKVNEYLEQVISNQEIGTGRKAYFEGYRMAGKTGTANKVINGTYSSDKWVLSFIGYAPVVNPKIMVCIIVDEPDLGGNYRRGSEVAPPMFKKIVVNSLKYMKVPYETKNLDREKFVTISTKVPDLHQLKVQQAIDTAKHFKLEPVMFGEGEQVLAQYPAAGSGILEYDKVYMIADQPGKIGLPDLTGRSLREVLQICNLLQKQCETDGEGFAVKQQMIKRGAEVVALFSFAAKSEQLPEQQVVAQKAEQQSE